MAKDAAIVPPRGLTSHIGILCLLLAASVQPARAAYVNPRLDGDLPWLPEHVRIDESLASLIPARPQGRLKDPSKVRQEIEIDLESGRILVRRHYGNVLVAPEWVQGLSSATLAAARKAARDEWVEQVKKRLLRPGGRRGQKVLSIELPVRFPDAVAGIIGQGARLNLTGSERITFSGTSNLVDGGPTFESGGPSAFPDLDMNQQLRVNLDGTIGEKIHVLVNHDSEVDVDFENKIRLRYDGEEDEVIQKIEMGNTDLSLPGAEFLSFRKSQQGLFGAKVDAKFGPLDLTAIASKQEGKTASQRFVGRARRDSVLIKDTEYVKRKYYWIADPRIINTILPLEGFELFLDDKDTRNDIRDGARLAFAHTDPGTGTPADTVGVHRGFYHRLTQNVDYTLDPQTGAIALERALPRDQALAAFYTYVAGDSTIQVGSLANLDTLSLQLLAPPERDLYDVAKGFTPLRDLEMKNVYFLGARNIRPESFELVIRRKASAAGQQDEEIQKSPDFPNLEFIRILGLDNKGLTDPEPDLLVEPEFVDFEDGTITFPNLTPFAPDSSTLNVIVSPADVSTGRSSEPGVPLLEYNEAIYQLEPDDLLNQDKYFLQVKYTTPTPSYSLNRFNILEGSERVRLNGRQLSRGADYDIDYDFGVLTFRTPDASLPDAEIEVDFEFVPLFGQAKESLVGLSGTYNFGPQTYLSSSWLFFTRATPEQRPRLGQEPSRILVGNLYGQWIMNPAFMTSLVNKVPLVRSDTESELQFQGEVALSIPNPNTKNEIYIDDMEGVEDSRELSVTRGVWVPASEPVGPLADLDRHLVRPLPFNWYNPENTVRREDVFIEVADEREGQDFIQVLEFAVRDQAAVDTSDPDSSGWMGIMRNLSTTGEDFSEKKFLEVWVNDFGVSEGKVIFDMGEISEDFYVRTPDDSLAEKGRGFLDTEDVNPYDGELTVSREDFGLDNVRGDDDTGVPGDDGDDDFEFRRATGDFSRINNYEGNSLLDTEDLDGDNFLDEDNAYLSYVVDLADTTVGQGNLVLKNFDPQLRPDNHWRLYRIPLDDGIPVGGVPRRRSVKYVRLWFDGLPPGPGVKAQIASVKIVGAAWLEEKISSNDTGLPVPEGSGRESFRINVVNNKEDSFYFPPFDPGEDTDRETRREQSLVIEYFDLPSGKPAFQGPTERGVPEPVGFPVVGPGRQGSAFKEILDTGQGKNQDFTQYATLSFFLRDGRLDGAGGLRPGFTGPSSGTFFLRFGPDTTNFYEFSTARLGAGPTGGWRELFIELQALTEMKLDPPQKTVTVEGVEVDYRARIVDGDTLAVYGAPSLARVRRLTLGIRGDDPTRPAVEGEVWVDEIRLRSVKKDLGYASRLTGNARFADLLIASGGARRIDSEFRRIEGERHGRNEFSWNLRGDLKLNKFFDGRGISLPITGDYSYQETTPRLAPNSDIELVDKEDKRAARSTTRSRSLSSRFAKTRPSKSGWLRYSVDNMSLSATTSTRRQRTPFLISEDENVSGQAAYNLNPGQGKTIRLLHRFDLSYFPTLKLGMNGNENVRDVADIREDGNGDRILDERDRVRTRSLEGSLGLQWDPLRSSTFDSQFTFNKRQDFDLRKDLGLWESFKRGGRELRRDHRTRMSYRPGLVRWLRPVLTYETNYVEDQGPAVQSGDPQDPRLRRVENNNTQEISTSLNLRQLFRKKAERPARAGRRARRATPGGGRASGTPAGEGTPGAGEEEDSEPEAKKKRPGLGDLYRKLGDIARMFGDIRYTYRDSRSSRFSRVGARPSLRYQFGLEDFDKRLLVQGNSLIEDNTNNTYSSKFETSLNPTASLFLDANYSRRLTKSARNGVRNQSLETTFPDLSMSLDGVERWALLKRWAKTSSINGSFRRETNRRGTLPPLGQPIPPGRKWFDTESIRRDFTPLLSWNTNWNSGLNTTLSITRTTNVDESEFNTVRSRTETTAKSIRLNGRYSFSAPKGISLFGRRLRFRSDLTLNFDLDTGEDKAVESSIREDGATTTTVRSHRKTLSVRPRATYNFSRKVQGSLDIGYSRTKDLQRDRTETTISVAVEALIKF